ncbi:hypothetical protein Pfo_013981 [Paulownia fortunei]|nr:hypothetical protein Pfo_013981 [Paulownia fortunei]
MTTRKFAVVKITTSNSSNAAGGSIGVVTRSMSKKLLSSSEITPLLETAEKDSPHLVNTNEDDGDLKDESASSTPRSASSYSFSSNITPVMVTNATTLEEQIASLIRPLRDSLNMFKSKTLKSQNYEQKAFNSRIQVSSDGLIPVDQLKEFIMGTIKDKFDGSSKSSLTYAKPYTQRIDNLKMTHMAHFIETCNDVGTYGDYLLGTLEQEFLNRFYSTRRTVSMIELTNSRQWKEEPVIDYINRWRNLSLNCKDRLSEASAIEMTFEELATRAHDMELSMAASGVEGPPIQEPQSKSFSKAPNKESMAVNVAPINFKGNTNDKSGEKKDTPQERGQRKLTLKEMQAKQYPFLDSDVSGIFDDLLKENLIELPEMKRPEEAGRVDDPKYCKYHHLVGHPIHDCFIFKDKVMQLARQGKISLEEDNATANLITIEFGFTNVIMENVPRCSDDGKLDYDNNISCNMTSEQKISSNEVCLFIAWSKPHNRPLFITGYTREQKVNRILIDGGSAVNILPLRTLKELGISMDELANSRLMIQGFNQGDAKTSYNMLLGRPWLHENGVIPSTWHQCFKYCRDGVVKRVLGDDKPFTEAESHFADAKYYLEDAKKLKAKDSPSHEKSNQQNDGRSSSTEVGPLKELVLPLTKFDPKKLSSQPLEGFVRPTQGAETEHGVCIGIQNTKCFDLKAYKLLVKAGYNPKESSVLGELLPETIGEQVHGLTATQKLLKESGHVIQSTRTGIGFVPQNLIRIAIKRASTNHVSEGEFSSTDDVFDNNGKKIKRISIFDRLGPLKNLIPSRMRRCTTLLISCEKVLKVKLQTIIFTQTQDDEDDRESIASSYHITLSEEMEEEDAEVAPPELEEGVKATVDELKEINLGDVDSPRPIYISALLAIDEERAYLKLLHELKMYSHVAVHHLSVKKGARPVKQAQRRFRPELVPLIEAEVNKLIEVGFIREVKYPTWISSIVPVRKKNGQIRVCVDFRDLNDACPKDDFPLPITELMIDATTGHEALSFMDGSSGYNQIRMAPKDEELTAFRTPKGIYCYKVMPAMQKIFDDMLHKNIECYVDDVVIKSKKREDHLLDLRKVLERLRRYQLKMNPLKCAFGVKSGKFLGFIVRHRGIEIEQAKVDAILKMPEPQDIHELKSLQGKLAYLRRFISNLAGRCQPFSRLMKKGIPFEWDKSCRNAFEMPGRPLILYIAAQERSVGALLAQENNDGKESALYYLSRMMTPNELNYSPIEKICLALIFTIQKLNYYFQAHTIRLISKANPLKYVMTRPVLSDRLARWYLQLQQFEIIYWELSDDLPDEDVLVIEITPWKMYFDGASHKRGAGAGVVFITSDGEVLPYSFTLIQNCSNNVAEYQALILGLEMAVDIKQLHLKVYGDSKLVINQLLGLYEVKKPELLPYFNYARRLIGWLRDIVIEHIPRTDNKQADALANLASILAMPEGEARVPICRSWVVPPIFEDENCDEDEENHVVEVFEVEKEDWRQPLVDYLKYEKLPDDPHQRVDIRRRVARFIHYKSTLYRRSFDGVFLRCLGDDEAIQAIEEAHSGICGAHQSGPKCQACQFHANLIHQPPEPLHLTIASWSFDAWGLDVVGPMTKSSGGHLYILAATDYFSKWAEAIPLKEVKKKNVADFIRINIIYRYGIPRYIITDNEKPFCNSLIDKLCQKFSFKQRKSSMYYAAANGLAEAFNKTLCTLLKKVIAKSKRDWHERIGEALWAYRTTFRTPTQATPYALVYGVEAIVPLEQQIPSLRIAIQEGLTEEENARLRLEELEALDEKRLEAQQRLECYQARLSRAFNKKVRSCSFQVGDLVLAVYTNGAYKLVAEDGLRIDPINEKFLKRYYA